MTPADIDPGRWFFPGSRQPLLTDAFGMFTPGESPAAEPAFSAMRLPESEPDFLAVIVM
jgi:hypothetical protein